MCVSMQSDPIIKLLFLIIIMNKVNNGLPDNKINSTTNKRMISHTKREENKGKKLKVWWPKEKEGKGKKENKQLITSGRNLTQKRLLIQFREKNQAMTFKKKEIKKQLFNPPPMFLCLGSLYGPSKKQKTKNKNKQNKKKTKR